MRSSRILALVLLLPVPAALTLWLQALTAFTTGSSHGFVLLTIVAASMVLLTVLSLAKIGPQYALSGSRTGLLLILAAIFWYLLGTWVQSDLFHVLSILVFYWGGVLYLGGSKSLASVLLSPLMLLSLFLPVLYGPWGVYFAGAISIAVIVVSCAFLLTARTRAELAACRLCASFKNQGESFCRACGQILGPFRMKPSYAKFGAFALFSLVLIVLSSLTVPIMTIAPSTSLTNFTLGGAQNAGPFAPLSGWKVRTHVYNMSGQSVYDFALRNGTASVEAIVDSSPESDIAVEAVNQTAGRMVNASTSMVPSVQSLTSYAVERNGTSYVGVQGVFSVDVLNGSKAQRAFVAVNLQQAVRSYRNDNDSTLAAASAAVADWFNASAKWSPVVALALPAYQFANQAASDSSICLLVVFLFSVVRSNGLRKDKRLESTFGLSEPETTILRAFGRGQEGRTGEELLAAAKTVDPSIEELGFYQALSELSRRDLVVPRISILRRRPMLLWKCLLD